MIGEIRRRLADHPFEPFVIRLADRRVLHVPHPEFLWLPSPGRCYYLRGSERVGECLNPLLIVSVQSQAASARKRREN